MALIYHSCDRPRKKRPERGVEVRSVVPRELADELRMMATQERCTLSDMIARLLVGAVQKDSATVPSVVAPGVASGR
jgi:hypothetical protein